MNREQIREALNQLVQENAPYEHVPTTYAVYRGYGKEEWGNSDWDKFQYGTDQMTLFWPVFQGSVMLCNWKGMFYLFHPDPHMSDHVKKLNMYGEFV